MPRTAIIAIQEGDKGELVFIDANGGEHRAHNASTAWMELKQILADPDLPETEMPNPAEVHIEEVITETVASFLPQGTERLAGPAVSGILDALRNISSRKDPRR